MEIDGIMLANRTHLGRRPRVVFGSTASVSVAFYGRLYGHLREQGFDVSVILSYGPELDATTKEGASVFAVPMRREISPRHDLMSLWRLWRLIRKIRPEIVDVGNPKAGLLGGLAAQ